MFVRTKSSVQKGHTEDSFETVVFKSKKNDRREPNKKEDNLSVGSQKPKKENNELDMKKLRYEVIKFGTSGFDGSKKEESRIAFAVALGAKPPKKKYRNYVDLLRERKAQSEKAAQVNGQNPNKRLFAKPQSKKKQNKRKETGELLHNYGKVKPS